MLGEQLAHFANRHDLHRRGRMGSMLLAAEESSLGAPPREFAKRYDA